MQTANDSITYLDILALDTAQKKIQLRNTFDVICTTNYRFAVFTPLGSKPVGFDIPMKVKLKGMSEKYWK